MVPGLYAPQTFTKQVRRSGNYPGYVRTDSDVRPYGPATDIGWMEFVRNSAQTASDAGAMAAVLQFQSTNFATTFTCGAGGIICQSPTSCDPAPTSYLHSGCDYAQSNGFSSTATNQSVIIASGVGVPPTAPGVNSSAYWVTTRVNQSVPQLFSAVAGNMNGSVAARATAALNPAKDCVYVMDPAGANAVDMNGSPSMVLSCGVYINSNNATALHGNGTPTLSATEIDIVGGYSFGGSSDWEPHKNHGAGGIEGI